MDPLIIEIIVLIVGVFMGYYARQMIAQKRAGTIEKILAKKIQKGKLEAQKILAEAEEKAQKLTESTKNEIQQRHKELIRTESLVLKRESMLEQKITEFEIKEKDFQEKIKKLKSLKENLEEVHKQAVDNLERVAGLSKADAKKELFEALEKEYQRDLLDKSRSLESDGIERFKKRAKEILVQAIQKCALSQAQEVTTSIVSLPSDDIKGRIIGKEGRNIRTLERLTGVEVIIDETPETVVISGFDPTRRQIAKIALEKLIQDSRIQPARIEETVKVAEEEIANQIKEAGEQACYDVGILDLPPRLVQLFGRLRFRTSYGQNVLLHSMEVAHLAGAMAAEVGGNVRVAKKAGLLHDIGKSIDQQIEGSHVEIGIKILEKFNIDPAVISAMKSHHEEFPYEGLEGILVQAADQISGARPGARKDTVENYLKRLGELEGIATSFNGVEKAWALQAGREIRVFVKPKEIDDWGAKKMAKEIAKRIEEELRYPGEIKVNVIRETRVTEYAK
ncbi:MAG TPA: ribonuclease Y [Candidatus Paceibacterota bacterium]|nr:ribonuclease Y [Candidatus Pacearchaeota archaeon]HRZ51304.1 ribonuclease Y [Candidatus Paceibacterota bacterium]HSA37026.1 ribonuclease Y [Candidatus Paceibacterota bacterium]